MAEQPRFLAVNCMREKIKAVNTPETRVAVVGAGNFGRNHARVYHELAQQGAVKLVAIVDADAGRARAIASQFGAESYGSIADMLANTKIDAATVAVPT